MDPILDPVPAVYEILYQLARLVLIGWGLMILLPNWHVTRWVARKEVFALILCMIYTAGVVPLLIMEPQTVANFRSASGVLQLLKTHDIALIIWVHVLAFDQFVATMIYQDNMEKRYVPLVVQSVILVLTLLFGPMGFLIYWLVRGWVRWRRASVGAPTGEPPETALSIG